MALRSVSCALGLLLASCGGPAMAPRPPSARMQIRVSRPATLMWALDAAAGMRNHDPGYRAWLGLPDEDPPWLAAYIERRRGWNELGAHVEEGAPDFDVCSYESADVAALERCLARALPPEDAAVAIRAVRAGDGMLEAPWRAAEAELDGLARGIEENVASDAGQDLLARLSRESGVPSAELDFDVVLVAKPPGEHSYARQAWRYLVHEVGDDDTAGSLAAIAYHEIAHLAHSLSPRREEMERAFTRFGDRGIFAAAMWDEVVASAFGNGLAAERLDPAFRSEAPYYDDPLVDRLARALHREWRDGAEIALGEELAARVVAHADRLIPASERECARYLWYATLYAEDSGVARLAMGGVPYRSLSANAPIEDGLPRSEGLPPWSPRIVVLTADELRARPALLATLALTPDALDAALHETGAAVWRTEAQDGGTLLAVVGRDGPARERGARALAPLAAFPAPGWTSLP